MLLLSSMTLRVPEAESAVDDILSNAHKVGYTCLEVCTCCNTACRSKPRSLIWNCRVLRCCQTLHAAAASSAGRLLRDIMMGPQCTQTWLLQQVICPLPHQTYSNVVSRNCSGTGDKWWSNHGLFILVCRVVVLPIQAAFVRVDSRVSKNGLVCILGNALLPQPHSDLASLSSPHMSWAIMPSLGLPMDLLQDSAICRLQTLHDKTKQGRECSPATCPRSFIVKATLGI